MLQQARRQELFVEESLKGSDRGAAVATSNTFIRGGEILSKVASGASR